VRDARLRRSEAPRATSAGATAAGYAPASLVAANGCATVLWRKRATKPLAPGYVFPYHAEMLTAPVLSAVHKKRARMAREIEAAERAIAKRREELETLGSVTLMFSSDCHPDMIPSVRPYLRGLYFGYREPSRGGLDAMRQAGGPVHQPGSSSTSSRLVVCPWTPGCGGISAT